jgi:hypothetical protein
MNHEPWSPKVTISSTLHPYSPANDHLSLTLHTLSCSKLTRLDLTDLIRISPSLFHGVTPADSPYAFWPNLKYFDIELNRTTATGEWHWEFDPENPEAVEAMDDNSDTDSGSDTDSEEQADDYSDSDNSDVPDNGDCFWPPPEMLLPHHDLSG